MRRIQSKITLTYVILIAVVVAAVAVLSSARIESHFKDRLIATVSNRAEVMWFLLIQEPILSFDVLDKRVKDLARLAEMRITLIDPDGRVISGSDTVICK
jgi:hypothetical protein